MSKQRRTVSVEPEVDDYLSRPEINASSLVNELVKRHMDGGMEDSAVLKLRKQQVESEVEHLKKRTENKLEELEALQEQLESCSNRQKERLQKAREQLEGAELDPANPAVQNWADKLDMTPEELVEELEEDQ